VLAFNRMVEQQLRESTKYAFLLPSSQGGGVGNGDALAVVHAKLKVMAMSMGQLQAVGRMVIST
jgi:hypothetical protein